MPSVHDIIAKAGDEHAKVIDALAVDTVENRETEEYIAEYKGKRERRTKSVGKRENKMIGEGKDRKMIEVVYLRLCVIYNEP